MSLSGLRSLSVTNWTYKDIGRILYFRGTTTSSTIMVEWKERRDPPDCMCQDNRHERGFR